MPKKFDALVTYLMSCIFIYPKHEYFAKFLRIVNVAFIPFWKLNDNKH